MGSSLFTRRRKKSVYLTVDYVMRHNPYWTMAAKLAQSGILGKLRHMDLANHANGLALADDHWFWDQGKSGGIWIEHGVHFFDAFSWVSGAQGEVIASKSYQRSDGRIDRVEGLFRYGDVAAHCYHAFDQSGQTEQTTVRLTFERGYITLPEWIPTELQLQTTLPRTAWESYLLPLAEVIERPDGQIFARSHMGLSKSDLYKQAIQDGVRNLAAAIQAGESLTVTGENGLDSLTTAVLASIK